MENLPRRIRNRLPAWLVALLAVVLAVGCVDKLPQDKAKADPPYVPDEYAGDAAPATKPVRIALAPKPKCPCGDPACTDKDGCPCKNPKCVCKKAAAQAYEDGWWYPGDGGWWWLREGGCWSWGWHQDCGYRQMGCQPMAPQRQQSQPMRFRGGRGGRSGC